MLRQFPPPRQVVVLGDDPVGGEALAILLESRGYRARFLAASALDRLGSGEPTALLLLVPGLSAARREDVLRQVRSMRGAWAITVVDSHWEVAGALGTTAEHTP